MLKKLRPNYDRDINAFTADEALTNLFTIYHIEDKDMRSRMAKLFCSISNIEVNYHKDEIHDDMNDTLEEFWNTRKCLSKSDKEQVVDIENQITALYSRCNTIRERNALVSIIRIPEYFYLSHKELSKIQKNPLDYLDQVSMLSTNKSIFKLPGKDMTLEELVAFNRIHIESHLNGHGLHYDDQMAESFKTYLKKSQFKNIKVKLFMDRMISNLRNIISLVQDDKILLYCSKISSAFYPGSKSIVEDNFWKYDTKLVEESLFSKLIRYDQLFIEGNYDYMRIGFGLGPDYKLRNIVFTNSILQSICSPIRMAAKKTAKQFKDDGIECPIKTDDQNTDFKSLIDKKLYKKYKVCFDLSKYSDYLLSQLMDLLIDKISPSREYADTVKRIFNMPIKIQDKFVNIIFGTGAGIKGNFDCITILNMLMIDFCGYYYDIDIKNIMVVGDDNYSDSDDNRLEMMLFKVYTHFNCKINKKKSRAVVSEGKISFCNRHWWLYSDGSNEPWNGLAPGLWMKQIYSLNRINAIYSLMKDTNQPIDIEDIDQLYKINRENIIREFKINYMEQDVDTTYQSLKSIPYTLNGLLDQKWYKDGEVCDWVDTIYYNLGSYIYAMSNNSKILDIFARYYKSFPNHPIIQQLLVMNGEYLAVMDNIETKYQEVYLWRNKDAHNDFIAAVRKAMTKFSKMDNDSKRISTKDRTSDFFNEDKFFKPVDITKQTFISERLSEMEIEALKVDNTDSPIAEMWLIMKNRHLMRDGWSNIWNPNITTLMRNERNGVRIRLYTTDSRCKNGNYENWNYSAENICFVFDQIYPENDVPVEEKIKHVRALVDAIYRMKRSQLLNITEILDLI